MVAVTDKSVTYQEKLLSNLVDRAKTNVLMYWFVWLSISFSFNVPIEKTLFFVVNSLALFFITAIRLVHLYLVKFKGASGTQFYLNWFDINLSITALHWGLLAAWVGLDPGLEQLEHLLMLVTAAFALGGAHIFSISDRLRVIYPFLILFPGVVVLFYENTSESILTNVIIIITFIHLVYSTRDRCVDYKIAIKNQIETESYAKAMENLCWTDHLTGLKSRLFFETEYESKWEQGLVFKSPLSLLMIDIDHFKGINDTYGHVQGDTCIQKVAEALSKSIDVDENSIARYGGEEFVVLLPNISPWELQKIAHRILDSVRSLEIVIGNTTVNCTVSVGGATIIPGEGQSREKLLHQADSALYWAKNSGRNQYQEYRYSSQSKETRIIFN